MNNTEILSLVLGWQTGTTDQVAQVLMVTRHDIINADEEALRRLADKAHKEVANRYPTVLLFLGLCLDNLKLDYRDFSYPTWLKKAIEVYNSAKGL